MLRSAIPTAFSILAITVAGCATATPSTTPGATASVPASVSATESAGGTQSAGASESAGAGESAGASQSAVPSPSAGIGGLPAVDPANFVTTIDNPWFPLIPGTTFTHKGVRDGEPATVTFQVTNQTRVVQGVTTTVIHDTLMLSGQKAEDTEDWYAQDKDGNVWYFGEATKELDESGKVVSTEGSWEAGVDGAVAGIYMPADPQVGQSLAQEFYKGHAEDHFVVLLRNASAKVPFGSFKSVLVTAEWTPLEPNVLGEKFYAKGVGQIREVAVAGEQEKLDLTAVRKP